jgi:hypothetical protein
VKLNGAARAVTRGARKLCVIHVDISDDEPMTTAGQQFFEKECVMTSTEQAAVLPVTAPRDLGQMGEQDPLRLEALRRWGYVRRVLATPGLRWNATSLTPVIAAVGESLKDDAPPSWHTVRRWVRAYEVGGRDVRALLPQQRAQGNRWQKVSGKRLLRYDETAYEKARTVSVFLDQAIRTHYLQRQRVTVRYVYEQLTTRILGYCHFVDHVTIVHFLKFVLVMPIFHIRTSRPCTRRPATD